MFSIAVIFRASEYLNGTYFAADRCHNFAFFVFQSSAPTPFLLLMNYNPSQTDFAQSRAEALGLSYERIADFTSAEQLKGKSVVIMPGIDFLRQSFDPRWEFESVCARRRIFLDQCGRNELREASLRAE